MNRWSFPPFPPWTRLLIRNPAKQVRPAAPFLPVFSSWSTRSSAPGFPPGHRLIRGLTRDTRGIYSAERRREDGNRERWETARISPPGCGEAGVYFPPPHRLQTPSLPLLIARGALEDDGDESVTESFAPLGATSLVASRHPPTRSF